MLSDLQLRPPVWGADFRWGTAIIAGRATGGSWDVNLTASLDFTFPIAGFAEIVGDGLLWLVGHNVTKVNSGLGLLADFAEFGLGVRFRHGEKSSR